jgi:uncharacterized protein
MIQRLAEGSIAKLLGDKKVIILYGPRQIGKTTLVESLDKILPAPILWLNGDDADVRELFINVNVEMLKRIIGPHKTLVLDEAQRIKDIGIALKIIHDRIPEVKVIATGSSSFDLANHINEPLTGRKWELLMLPLSHQELSDHFGYLHVRRTLEDRLIYGSYPEMVLHPGSEAQRLSILADSYLYKDVYTLEKIQKPEALEKLLKALAFQVGNQVSYHELGQIVGLDNQTVEKYISMLERAFIIFRLPSFNRNLRNELKKSRKIYFHDNGIRNAVINQFQPLRNRQDTGALWENYIISERMKMIANQQLRVNSYFWRNHNGREIDYVEEKDGQFSITELKWKPGTSYTFPSDFLETYAVRSKQVIHPENFDAWLTGPE